MRLLWMFVWLVAYPVAANPGVFGPSSYDECILDSMKGVTSDQAAALIAFSCRQKFPEKALAERSLTVVEMAKLTGRAGPRTLVDRTGRPAVSNYYSGQLYNGHRLLTITKISVSVQTLVGGIATDRIYTVDISARPQTTTDFGFDFVPGDRGTSTSWRIVSAKGTGQ